MNGETTIAREGCEISVQTRQTVKLGSSERLCLQACDRELTSKPLVGPVRSVDHGRIQFLSAALRRALWYGLPITITFNRRFHE